MSSDKANTTTASSNRANNRRSAALIPTKPVETEEAEDKPNPLSMSAKGGQFGEESAMKMHFELYVHEVVNLNQYLKEGESVSVLWRRGKGFIETRQSIASKEGTATFTQKIDLKSIINVDNKTGKYEAKNTQV